MSHSSQRHQPGQFARILPTLESARRRTKPRTVDLYDVFCGVLYLLKSGCQWRMLPADFPNWRTCYKYFRQWSERWPRSGFHSGGPKKNRLAVGLTKWTERADQLLYWTPRGQEHGHRWAQGL